MNANDPILDGLFDSAIPTTRALAADLRDVDRALSIADGLTKWECEFVESLGRQVKDDNRPLTAKQRARLDPILTRFGL